MTAAEARAIAQSNGRILDELQVGLVAVDALPMGISADSADAWHRGFVAGYDAARMLVVVLLAQATGALASPSE